MLIQKVPFKKEHLDYYNMKFFTVIVLALFFICAVQAQRGGNRRPGGQAENQGGNKGCPDICPLNFQPTCGFNGRCYKEFSNTCALSVANCNGKENYKQVAAVECNKRGARIC